MHWGYSGEQYPPGAGLRDTDVRVWKTDKEETKQTCKCNICR